uniref:Uncharacterized protein n=1 Tax=Octactis speculum TaxID=3111310 RepID=A0A7S2GGW3_9STRA|mmetsp:Transcript_45378/g.61927  ORF Transcript_45378/g.61927 Transcript_45378/m.61927 type:complete len:187 (+) Transcript_45378:55-615(+)
MGSRPSASIDSGEARGRQSGVVHPREEDEASDAFARRMALPGREEFREMRGEVPGSYSSLSYWGFGQGAVDGECFDDGARGDCNGAVDGTPGGNDLEPGMVDDDAVEDDYYSGIGVEAAYCRAAASSHTAGVQDGDLGGDEVGPVPFGGQGSVMYSYRESSKMRFGTLNISSMGLRTVGVSRLPRY